jgi:hypothetical protein
LGGRTVAVSEALQGPWTRAVIPTGQTWSYFGCRCNHYFYIMVICLGLRCKLEGRSCSTGRSAVLTTNSIHEGRLQNTYDNDLQEVSDKLHSPSVMPL